ncbi:MAG TPA: MraY family glycosyltransferase [Acidobacteriaceae bacterium]|nr:MraY family glycosyltransferase [Acidobacteriaceae bacterium]
MSRFAVLAVPFVIAYLSSLLIVPLVRRFALSNHLLDQPDHLRHRHAAPVPRLGGVAIFVGLLLAFAVAPVVGLLTPMAPAIPHLTAALILASAILFGIGLLDDLHDIPPLAKLAGQVLAATVVVYSGFHIDVITLPPDYSIALGWLAIPVTLVWLVGVSNALNLVDGLDGLAGGVGMIALLAATAAAFILGNPNVPWYTLGLAGALLAFLHFNSHPAKIFLGDSGSLVVGFLLAVLTVKGATRPDQSVYALAPIFALSYPLLDTGIAMMRRWLRGAPLSRADARHIHHQLRALGLGPRKAVWLIYIESATVAVLGLCVTFAPPQLTVAVAATGGAVLLFIMVYGVRWLEYHEFVEAGASVASAAKQARWVIQDKIHARDVAYLIHRADSFDRLASIVEESAQLFRFAHMELRWGASPRHLPEHIAGELHSAHFCKLEYPILQHGSRPNDLVVLNIWCTTGALPHPVGAERVARIIAPAVAVWMGKGAFVPPATVTQSIAAASPNGPAERAHRHQRSVASSHAIDGERTNASTGMVAKPSSRGDELRS